MQTHKTCGEGLKREARQLGIADDSCQPPFPGGSRPKDGKDALIVPLTRESKHEHLVFDPRARSRTALLAALAIVIASGRVCADCDHPPPAWGSDWTGYAQWCAACGGTADVNTNTCTPGPNWGAPPVPDYRSQPNNSYQPQQGQREQQERERAEAAAKAREKARREQFQQDKQKALSVLKSDSTGDEHALKGVGANDTGLKGMPTPDLKLKEPLFSHGTRDSAPPDLRGLGGKWPIVADLKQVQDQTPQALHQANLRTHMLLDALEAGHGDWQKSIDFLLQRLSAAPGDRNLTTALNLVRGYYNGYLGAKEVADNYYRYGVRQWLSGDFDGAARAFARAYRENPDDTLLFKSFAHTLGLRDGSGKCKATYACSHIDIPHWSLVDELHIRAAMEHNLAQARATVSANPSDRRLRANLDYLEGLSGYHDWLQQEPDQRQAALDGETLALTNTGLDRIGQGDYVGAFQAFAKAAERNKDDRGVLFAMSYARGLGAARNADAAQVPDALWERRTRQVYEEDARQIDAALLDELLVPGTASSAEFMHQLKNTGEQNPLFGRLSDKAVKSLTRWRGSLFR